MAVRVVSQREMPAEPSPHEVSRSALRLLQFEVEIRRQESVDELFFHLVNQLRVLVPYSQAVLLRRPRLRRQWQVAQVSDVPTVDRGAPLIRALEQRIRLLDTQTHPQLLPLDVSRLDQRQREVLAELPYGHGFWLPLVRHEQPLSAGVLLLRETDFSAAEIALLLRTGETYSHAWRALDYHRHVWKLGSARWWAAGVMSLLLILCVIPVRMSVMAPVEVVADHPFVLTAPFNGVVKSILVPPNTRVSAGTPLLQFEDIDARNDQVRAEQELAVAQARAARVTASAFSDSEAASELAIVRAEYILAQARYQYANEVLARTRVNAPRDGLVIYTDRRDWEGRAVSVGEQILEVADPEMMAYRIALPVGNAVELKNGADVSIYLDGSPLGGSSAQVRTLSYVPKVTPEGVVSYTVMADGETDTATRIGARGTARLYGERVPLIWQLLRRPLNSVRQWLGL